MAVDEKGARALEMLRGEFETMADGAPREVTAALQLVKIGVKVAEDVMKERFDYEQAAVSVAIMLYVYADNGCDAAALTDEDALNDAIDEIEARMRCRK